MPVASTGAAAPGLTAGWVWRPMVCGDGPAHRPALVFDLDDGQVERGEQQIHDAADQGCVDRIAVGVQRHRGGGGDPALFAPQKRAPQQPGIRARRRGAALGVIALHRGGAGFRMHAAVVLLMKPGGEQPVQLGQRLHRAGSLDLDQELLAHGAVPALDLAPPLRFSGPAVHQRDVEHRRRPRQLMRAVCRAVVDIQFSWAAVGFDRVVQRGLHAQGVLAVAPPMPGHVAGVVIKQREQHRPPAGDDRAVQPVADPHLVGFGGLEPAERGRRVAVGTGAQFQAGEVALQGARRRRPPLLGLDDAGDVGRSTGGVFALEPRRQLQHLGVGARGDLAFGRDQCVEPAGPPRPNPAVQAGP